MVRFAMRRPLRSRSKRQPRLLSAFLFPLALSGCASAPPATPTPATPPGPSSADTTPAQEDIARARRAGKKQSFTWEEYGPAALARAQREGKLVLLDCVATWCHWCHVMDDTTYTDDALGQLLRERVVAMRVDIDARPDIAARYEDYGWPATILFDPRGEELGKFKGYLTPELLRERIEQALSARSTPTESRAPAGLLVPPVTAGMMGWIGAQLTQTLDDFYDPDEGGWGRRQKLPLGPNIEFELLRARHQDDAARARARFTLKQQRALIDPVWGGMYQYSLEGVWTKPHFEKRLPIQTAAIEASARAFALLKDPADRADAERIGGYLMTFLRNRDGLFLVSQDADLGGHEKDRAFVDGHDYYGRDDAGRRALGIPRIDDHVYAYENGLAISALSVLTAALSGQPEAGRWRGVAQQAADAMLRTHVEADGTVKREAIATTSLRFLADAAALGRGLAELGRLGEARYRIAAERVVAAMWQRFHDPQSSLLWVSTIDPGAAGVFARRERPFGHNVLAARALLAVAALPGVTESNKQILKTRARAVLVALATPERLSSQGRVLGEYLLALAEAGLLRWAG